MPNLILIAVTLVIYFIFIVEIIFGLGWFFFLTEPFQPPNEVCQTYALSLHKSNNNEVANDVKNNIDKKNDCKCVHCVSCFNCFYYIILQIYKKVSLRNKFFYDCCRSVIYLSLMVIPFLLPNPCQTDKIHKLFFTFYYYTLG